jgi:uncharacterized protein YaaR (DUF327 family)
VKINRRSEKQLKKQLDKWKKTGESAAEGPSDETSQSAFDETYDANKLDMLDMEVQDLVEELDKRGDALVKHPTPTHIREYQQALASFLGKAMELSKEIERIQGKRNLEDLREGNDQKEHVIVKTIDQKVDEMANQVLESQEQEIDLAERIGELQGLVVDLMSTIEEDKTEVSEAMSN